MLLIFTSWVAALGLWLINAMFTLLTVVSLAHNCTAIDIKLVLILWYNTIIQDSRRGKYPSKFCQLNVRHNYVYIHTYPASHTHDPHTSMMSLWGSLRLAPMIKIGIQRLTVVNGIIRNHQATYPLGKSALCDKCSV